MSTELDARVDFAWRCHAAQEAWTAKVDAKASIFLTGNFVGLGALAAGFSSAGGYLSRLAGWHEVVAVLGTSLCGLAAVVACAVIYPQLGPSRRAPGDVVYFGDVRGQSPEQVAAMLGTAGTDRQLEQLARQLVAMGKANWTKHRLFQLALIIAWLGYGSVIASTIVR